jgi:hypothetical protein
MSRERSEALAQVLNGDRHLYIGCPKAHGHLLLYPSTVDVGYHVFGAAKITVQFFRFDWICRFHSSPGLYW